MQVSLSKTQNQCMRLALNLN